MCHGRWGMVLHYNGEASNSYDYPKEQIVGLRLCTTRFNADTCKVL